MKSIQHGDRPKVSVKDLVEQAKDLSKRAQAGAPTPATKVSDELLEMMNQAISMEIQVSIQYMWQHVTWSGIKGYAFHAALKDIAIEEMKHAEAIAERLWYLGETPSTEPTPIYVGEGLRDMLQQNDKDERATIELYKRIIRQAMEEQDETTAQLFREILVDEEEHHDSFISVLEAI